MSEIVDDLLHEVEQLEASTQDLESSVQKVNQQVDQAKKADQNASAEANLLALEAAKTAQEASIQSQKAAQISIKQAEQLKAQALELNESNFNWRQAVRNAAKDFQSAKSSFAIMLTISIVISLSAAGAVGYLFYAMQKEEAKFKGEVLDIITTENTLLNKKITLKMDELASVIENLTYEVSKMNTSASSAKTMDILKEAKSKADMPMNDKSSAKQTEMPEEANLHSNKTETAVAMAPTKTDGHKHQEMTEKAVIQAMNSQDIAEAVRPIIEKAIKEHNHPMVKMGNAVSKDEVNQLKTLVEKVLTQQTALQTQLNKQAKMIQVAKKAETTQTESKTSHATPGQPMMTAGLSEQQVKKLNDISWLIRKQSKTLKSIQARLGSAEKAEPASTTVIAELQNLKQQQSMLQKQLLNMQKGMQTLIEKANKPNPYKYQAK